MILTKEELIKEAKKYADVEIYGSRFGENSFHTDEVCSSEYETIEQLPDEFDGEWTYMDEEDYNNSLFANCGEHADFAESYGDKDARVLCILVY